MITKLHSSVIHATLAQSDRLSARRNGPRASHATINNPLKPRHGPKQDRPSAALGRCMSVPVSSLGRLRHDVRPGRFLCHGAAPVHASSSARAGTTTYTGGYRPIGFRDSPADDALPS